MSDGVLILSYGTPERLGDVPAYYTHIRRGSPPPPELLEELIDRYRAVGGPTALNRITREQASALEAALLASGRPARTYVGFKHVPPFVEDAVERMAADGVTRAVGLVLAPHYSLRSIAEYIAAAEAKRPPGLALDMIESWHDHPGYVALLARRLVPAVAGAGPGAAVVFTAHSVPARVLEKGDPYPDQLRRTCELVAALVGLPSSRWAFAYQSAGRTADPWLGPDVREVIAERAAAGTRSIVVQSVGFVADHLEIRYDLDLEARAAAERLGLGFSRTPMPNADPDFIAVLADLVGRRLADDAPERRAVR